MECRGIIDTQDLKKKAFHCIQVCLFHKNLIRIYSEKTRFKKLLHSLQGIHEELISLKEGEIILRRKTNRMKKCGGCKTPLIEKVDFPEDLVFCRKEKRPKRGCTWKSKNEDDFVITNTHYHVNKKCIKNIDPSKTKISVEVYLNKTYLEYFKTKGIQFE